MSRTINLPPMPRPKTCPTCPGCGQTMSYHGANERTRRYTFVCYNNACFHKKEAAR